MRDAVIVEAVRTPAGKRNGALSGIHPADLSAYVLTRLSERAGVDPVVVDDVVWGCASQIAEQTYDIARIAVLAAGWPESVTGVTVDRQCGSSQQAVHFAAAGLIAGHYDVVVAGGVESMSRVPMGSSTAGQQPYPPSFQDRYGAPHQGLGAEMVAEKWGFSRSHVDEFAIRDIGAFEVNEAFAPVPMAWLAETGADERRLNPLGGAIALGHPLGASGARLMTTLIHHMRNNRIRYGLQTMCEAGGQANATIIELLA